MTDLSSLARERVQLEPPPKWSTPCDYDPDFKAATCGPVTYLLIERQINAELYQTYVRVSMRLENMQAVQHQSQWRLEFEPQTQSVVLHSIKVRRASSEREHASPARLQFLQREAGLDRLVVDGWITLLLVLEDVVPGDVLEWSYTLTDRPKLLPEHVGCFFFLPAGAEIGKYFFSVQHAKTRTLKWKSLKPELAPTTVREGGEVRFYWLEEKVSLPEPEQFTPTWQLNQPWIQVSDFPDWHTVARGVLHAWKEEEAGDGLRNLVEDIKSAGPEVVSRIERAIEIVQDEFRYLSVNLELGGQVPASAETVIRRRYGDCKDVAFLLVRLLHGIGVTAKPVLVNTTWRRNIGAMLPSPGVFNHVVVEFEIENQKRWVDGTAKCQGGGALTRLVSDFGLGLPIDTSTSALAPVPPASLPSGSYEIKESFQLDTFGGPSILGVSIIARGIHAEEVRFEFENEGVESIAKKHLQLCANRYSRAARIGQLQFRDDKEQNEFEIAEVFEIDGFLSQDGVPESCLFQIRSDFVAGILLLPSALTRQTPLAVPYPCQHSHSIEIHHNGLPEISVPIVHVGNKSFSFSRRCRTMHKYFKATFSLQTLVDSIPADQLQEHRRRVEEVWQACGFIVRLPTGYGRMGMRGSIGQLSVPSRRVVKTGKPAPIVEAKKENPPVPAIASSQPPSPLSPPPRETDVGIARRDRIVQMEAGSLRKSATPLHPRDRRVNKRCIRSLRIFVIAIGIFVLAWGLSFIPGTGVVVGLLVVLMFATICWSLVLAIIGLRLFAKFPGRYSRGKTPAVATLILGTISLVVLAIAISSSGRARSRQDGYDLLKFETLNFNYHSPSPPWAQIDAKTYGPGAVVGFLRPEPMYFGIFANRLEPGIVDPRARLIEVCRSNLLGEATSFQLVSEREVARNGLAGWQIESVVNVQGREHYVVHWLLVTNGFGYQLTLWGPTGLSDELRREANCVFSNFTPTKRDK